MNTPCNKKKFDKIGAEIALACACGHPSERRRDARMYFCGKCRAYHLTSKPFIMYPKQIGGTQAGGIKQ
ncbi:MAG: hypothetical protein A2487_02115 [Candidatus Raymondbacteria bacterium RifOxyC12_full_50_8]|uniref:Uncharacterized protein n=1 Tax=Candidatus Raymondbacteria bacterium RIFOXYD12_FULL_49_13 TaxID=1817890 RepID=A0A1F7FHG2_UNCRA|nr:MAG: hypothetical protein A2248_00855 [Candidatus Raymondbacteria bacterium RIFOXYA2_FULL_49_16]OGJ95871.1 MAG: hypothetical protein A2350_13375 [Candidatus Raymondbacteria bacterium RifOxyB12_full_50_8]OGK04874.1 MAG: hypothetical protein A2487_02115 [Candidatus Raymondbacteria bacterium RifOxyC12_full_50_8]OGK06021.1 MAG: hypothetical protein A2519_14725 [Candidatus Raymondbacteria bacterium RIFOXYD12_FULL_49_13]OGP42255.1 MAG: hypothetical protein A2324_01400 [Candidatus Raymondbacteria b